MMISTKQIAEAITQYVEHCNLDDLLKLYNHLTKRNLTIDDIEV